MWGVAAVITCTILPSAVAFTSLVSAAGVPSAAAYGLISLGRLTLTSGEKLEAKWSLGRLSKPFQFISVLWNGWVVAVLFSPYSFPVEASTLNCRCRLLLAIIGRDFVLIYAYLDAPIILGIVTIFALISWFFTPATAWVPRGRLSRPVEDTE